MNKISKTMVCALLMPAAPAFAVQGAPMPLETRNVAVTSVMADRLSETAAGLAAVRETGDSAKTDALLARLYAGGALKESAVPVYADGSVPAPAAAPAVSSAPAAEPEIPVTYLTDAEIAARDEALAAAKAKKDAEEAADKKKEDAAKLKTFKSGVGMMLLGLLLLLLLL